jgi:transcriptional regulator with XRE-family HTH domain
MPSEQEIVIRIGARLRQLRIARRLSQQRLGRMLGLSFQQIQKYEAGATALSSARLAILAARLQVPVLDFYDGVAGEGEDSLLAKIRDPVALHLALVALSLPRRERIELRRLVEALAERRSKRSAAEPASFDQARS